MLMRYSAWANQKLYVALMQAGNSVVETPRKGRPSGLIGVASHLYVVDLIWKAHLLGVDHGFKSRNLDQQMPLPKLRNAQEALDQWYVDYADAATEDDLNQVVNFKFVDDGSGSLPRGDILLHIANHKTYHRGYIADMLYDSGLKPPTMDLPVFLRDAWPAP